MAYAVPNGPGWKRLRWPAIKLSDGTEVRPGEQGVTPELLAAVGAVEIVDPGPTLGENETVESRALVDVDGTPTVEYTVRPLTADELAAKQQAAEDEADRDAARQAVTNLRAYIDTTSPTAAQTVGVVKLLCRVAIRLIRDQYGR